MAKLAPDAMIDASLDYVAACDLMVACSAEPSSYNDAVNVVDLADVTLDSGDFAKANDTSGRKLTIAAQIGVTIDHSGTATHIALCKVGDTTLRYVTTCNSQALVEAATVDFAAFKINIADPT